MTRKTEKTGIGNMTSNKREALAEELFEKAIDYTKRNNDDPEESDPVKLLDRAIELSPKPKYYYKKASELFEQYCMWDIMDSVDELNYKSPYKKPTNATTDYSELFNDLLELTSKALELNPEYSQAYYMNARIYNQLDEHDIALTAIHRALSMRPDSSYYYGTLHEILFSKGDMEGALVAINKALELSPDGDRVAEDKCNLLKQMGRYQEALDVIRAFSVKETDDPIIEYFDISVPLLIKLSEFKKAMEVLTELLNNCPQMWKVHFLITELYNQGHYSLLAGLPIMADSLNLKVLWIIFWSNIHDGNYEHAREFMAAMSFEKELTTNFLDSSKIRIDGPDREAQYSISMLFSLAQPYEKVPMDLFLLLLQKIFNGRYARQYFDEKIGECRQKWETEPELITKRATYGEQFYDVSLKIMLLGDVARFVHKLNKKKAVLFSLLQSAMNTSLMSSMNSIMLKVQLDERNRILSNLSHSIKNMLKSVIDPLIKLREEIPQKTVIIDNAIKGANLIREIVNAINLSFKTTLEDLKWDVINPGKESMNLQDMVVDSLRFSISNMFDSRYFPAYSEKYFPRSLGSADYDRIRKHWNEVSAGSVQEMKSFLDKYMFCLELSLDESRDYHVGNEKSSAIKLLILFQEIIFNAVKYASYSPFPKRMVSISLSSHGNILELSVKNSYNPKVQAKTTGVGKVVIENFARVLGCEPRIETDNHTYSITLEFQNLWRNNA